MSMLELDNWRKIIIYDAEFHNINLNFRGGGVKMPWETLNYLFFILYQEANFNYQGDFREFIIHVILVKNNRESQH